MDVFYLLEYSLNIPMGWRRCEIIIAHRSNQGGLPSLMIVDDEDRAAYQGNTICHISPK